jgi:hypothetical protein
MGFLLRSKKTRRKCKIKDEKPLDDRLECRVRLRREALSCRSRLIHRDILFRRLCQENIVCDDAHVPDSTSTDNIIC